MRIEVHGPRTSKLIRLLTGRKNFIRNFVRKFVHPILWDNSTSLTVIITFVIGK